MPQYRRNWIADGTFFFTLVTFERRPWLCDDWARAALRKAVTCVRRRHPFDIDAWVLLPDHLHCIWTLPPLDRDYATRWRLIRMLVAKPCCEQLPAERLSAREPLINSLKWHLRRCSRPQNAHLRRVNSAFYSVLRTSPFGPARAVLSASLRVARLRLASVRLI